MISLYDFLEATDGQLFGEVAAEIFTDVTFDVRRVEPGCIFVALETEHRDGHQLLKEAVERGALGLICAHPPDFDTEGVTVLIVRHLTEQALLRWAELVLAKFGTTVIGVMGAAGKSIAKEAIAAVLGTQYNVYQTPGSSNGRLELAQALGKLSAQHQLAVIELASTQPEEMAAMVKITQPLVGVVVNVGSAYSEQPDNSEDDTGQEWQLIKNLPEGGLAVLNYDDPQARAMADRTDATVFSVGIDSFYADLLAYNIVVGRHRTGFDLRYGAERFVGRWIPLLGRHQLYSVMAALAVGLSYQIPLADALDALTRLEPMPGCLRPLKGVGGSLLVDDTFSAGPESVQVALEWLGSIRQEDSRLIFVMGDLDHVGGSAQRVHHLLGASVAGVTDLFVAQGNLAAITGRAALDYGMTRKQVLMSYAHQDTVTLLRSQLGPNDVVLLKGSASARLEQAVRQLLADEADVGLLARQEDYWLETWTDQRAHSSWVEVDLQATADNVRRVKELIGPDVALMAMVSADAFGHGAVSIGSTAVLNGAAYLGVSFLAEAVELRDSGLDVPILIMDHVPVWAVRDAIHYNLTVSIHDLKMARLYNRIARGMYQSLRVHINVDTGIGQFGMSPAEANSFFRSVKNMTGLQVEGIFTQFSNAGEDDAYTRTQLTAFEQVVGPVSASGIAIEYIHAANTAAMLTLPESHFTMVRCASGLFGVAPSLNVPLPEGFVPTLQWKTAIAQIRELPRGSYVGEANLYRVMEDTERIAVIPVGYTDGFRGYPTQWNEVLVRGQRVPVVGRVGARECAINVTAVLLADTGDEVVLIGRQGDETITVSAVADHLGIGVKEVLSTILPRIPRL